MFSICRSYRSVILSAAPNLKELDGESLPSNQDHETPPLSQYEAMCMSQIQAQDDLQVMQQNEIE